MAKAKRRRQTVADMQKARSRQICSLLDRTLPEAGAYARTVFLVEFHKALSGQTRSESKTRDKRKGCEDEQSA